MENIIKDVGTGWESTENKFYGPGTIPACNPDNTCEGIQDFLENKTDDLEIIKNQFDLAFKDKSRMTIIRDYTNQQLIDAQKDLDAVNATIEKLNVAYLNLITT